MIYDEHIKNANRSKLRKNRSADLLFSRKVQRLNIFAEIPDFQGSRPSRARVAQPAWRWGPGGHLARRLRRFPALPGLPPASPIYIPQTGGFEIT